LNVPYSSDISAPDKLAISPLPSLLWVDQLVHTQCEETLMKVMRFVIYKKLLSCLEVMNLLVKAYKMSAILKGL